MTTTPVWFESLTDSVFALGAAAREAQRAARAAELTRDAYDLDRLRPVDGKVRLDGRDPGAVPFRPHDDAVFQIGDIHRKQADKLRSLYVQAALGYAYGTAWAIRRVLDGHTPDAVQLGRTREGHYLIPGELFLSAPPRTGLEQWSDYPKYVQAHARLLICEEAGLFADCLDDQPNLTEREITDMHEAMDTASGLPDAACDFGRIAESALSFVLLKPKAQHATNSR